MQECKSQWWMDNMYCHSCTHLRVNILAFTLVIIRRHFRSSRNGSHSLSWELINLNVNYHDRLFLQWIIRWRVLHCGTFIVVLDWTHYAIMQLKLWTYLSCCYLFAAPHPRRVIFIFAKMYSESSSQIHGHKLALVSSYEIIWLREAFPWFYVFP